MRSLRPLFKSNIGSTKKKIIGIFSFLLVVNVLLWIVVVYASRQYITLLSFALLAYGFGLRHAVDADHISAIDNTTRKLMQEGKRPVGVGFFFSLGHSTIVICLCLLLSIATAYMQKYLPDLQAIGSIVGTSISCLFLYLIAAINILVLWDIYKAFCGVTKGEGYNEQQIEEFLNQRGLLGRFFKPLLNVVKNSWNMYPIGVLFGLGFDTASEVAILAISATTATSGMPIYYVMLLPLMFTAGMCLIDTADGVLMLGAYGWAFIKPVRKLYYNLNITLISVFVAIVVGTIEFLQVISTEMSLTGGIWNFVGNVSFEDLGYIIIGVFVLSWLLSTAIYKLKDYESLNVNDISLTS